MHSVSRLMFFGVAGAILVFVFAWGGSLYLALLSEEPSLSMPELMLNMGPEICDDGVDNDMDSLIDMEDDDCWEETPPTYPMPEPEICNDGVDNDMDGLIDMEDGDCWEETPPTYPMPEPEICNDGVDNDMDSLIDMEDDDCW